MTRGASRTGIKRLSASTSVVDCREVVTAYLKSVGHIGSSIGHTVVWVRYERGRVVQAAASEEELRRPEGKSERERETAVSLSQEPVHQELKDKV
jgi:hypothetical protein